MRRPQPSFPRRSPEGSRRHSRKKAVRGAYLDHRPRRRRRSR